MADTPTNTSFTPEQIVSMTGFSKVLGGLVDSVAVAKNNIKILSEMIEDGGKIGGDTALAYKMMSSEISKATRGEIEVKMTAARVAANFADIVLDTAYKSGKMMTENERTVAEGRIKTVGELIKIGEISEKQELATALNYQQLVRNQLEADKRKRLMIEAIGNKDVLAMTQLSWKDFKDKMVSNLSNITGVNKEIVGSFGGTAVGVGIIIETLRFIFGLFQERAMFVRDNMALVSTASNIAGESFASLAFQTMTVHKIAMDANMSTQDFTKGLNAAVNAHVMGLVNLQEGYDADRVTRMRVTAELVRDATMMGVSVGVAGDEMVKDWVAIGNTFRTRTSEDLAKVMSTLYKISSTTNIPFQEFANMAMELGSSFRFANTGQEGMIGALKFATGIVDEMSTSAQKSGKDINGFWENAVRGSSNYMDMIRSISGIMTKVTPEMVIASVGDATKGIGEQYKAAALMPAQDKFIAGVGLFVKSLDRGMMPSDELTGQIGIALSQTFGLQAAQAVRLAELIERDKALFEETRKTGGKWEDFLRNVPDVNKKDYEKIFKDQSRMADPLQTMVRLLQGLFDSVLIITNIANTGRGYGKDIDRIRTQTTNPDADFVAGAGSMTSGNQQMRKALYSR